MPDIKDLIKDEYEFQLADVQFHQLDDETSEDIEYSIHVHDELKTDIQEKDLCVTITRKAAFKPRGVFEASVQFKVILHFCDEASREEAKKIDWITELKKQNATFIINVTSRISGVLSSLTAAAGQVPLITPPTIIE